MYIRGADWTPTFEKYMNKIAYRQAAIDKGCNTKKTTVFIFGNEFHNNYLTF